MRGDDQQFAQQCLEKLDSGAKASLQDTMAKVLQRVAKQPEGKEEEIDNTFLKWSSLFLCLMFQKQRKYMPIFMIVIIWRQTAEFDILKKCDLAIKTNVDLRIAPI